MPNKRKPETSNQLITILGAAALLGLLWLAVRAGLVQDLANAITGMLKPN